MIKRQVEPQPRTGTIPAAEFLQPNTTDTLPTPQTWTGVKKGSVKT